MIFNGFCVQQLLNGLRSRYTLRFILIYFTVQQLLNEEEYLIGRFWESIQVVLISHLGSLNKPFRQFFQAV